MKKFILEFLRILAIVTGYPAQLLFFKRKTYYEDRQAMGRRIKGSAIVISNHISIMDFMLYLFVFPFRKFRALIAEVMYSKNKLLSFVLDCMGGIYVDRNNFDMGFIDPAVSALDCGDLLGIFPESKLEDDDHKLLDFKPSYILIALKSGAPIIPCATDGNYGFFKRASVIIGKPIYLSDYCNSSNPTKEEIDALNTMVRSKVASLIKELDRKKKAYKKKPGFIKTVIMDSGRYFAFLFNIVFRIKVHGKENLKIKGKYIIASNHPGFFDPVIVMCTFWRRRLNLLAAKEVLNKGLRASLLRAIGCIALDREIFDLEAFKKCSDILEYDGALVVFPEGHRNDGESESLREFKSGAALLHVMTGAPVLPFYMKKKKKSIFSRTHVYIGNPIKRECDDQSDIIPVRNIDEISQRIYDEMKKLEEESKNAR